MRTLSFKNQNILRGITNALSMITCLTFFNVARAEEPYSAMLEKLRSEITAKMPAVSEATRNSIVEAKDKEARVMAVRNSAELDVCLSNSELDAKLARFSVLRRRLQTERMGRCLKCETKSLQLAVNDSSSPTNIELPFTIGMWGESEPVTVTLKQGTNTLNFWRDQAPQYGVAVKSFTLKPVVEP